MKLLGLAGLMAALKLALISAEYQLTPELLAGVVVLLLAFPPVTGGYSSKGQWLEYPPPMKQASVIWRLGNEGGLDMRDFLMRSHFDRVSGLFTQ